MDYRSVSQTPWATPLIYPQSVWLAGLVIFAAAALVAALRASWLLVRGRLAELNRDFQPRSAKEELDDEMENLSQRLPSITAARSS